MSGQPPEYGGGYGPPQPYGQDPYAQGGYPPAAPGPGAGPLQTRRGLTPLGRVGMILIALGGIAFAIAGTQDIIASEGGLPRVEGDAPTIVIGAIVAVLALAAAFLPMVGLHLTAIAAGAGFALFAGLVVITAKTNEVFDFSNDEPSLKTGGYLAILAFALGIIGVFVALAGLIHKTPQQPVTQAPGSAGTSGKSVASLVLSILGVVIPLLAAAGIGLGILGLEDHRRSGGAIGGKGKATAGVVIGLIVLIGYTVGLAIGIPAVEAGS